MTNLPPDPTTPRSAAVFPMNKTTFRRIAVAVLAAGLMTLIWANRTGRLDPKPYQDTGKTLPVTAATTWPGGSIPVTIGVFVENIYNFEVQSQTFAAEGRTWLIWPKEFQALLDAEKTSPAVLLDFANAVAVMDFSLQTTSEPVLLPDGRYYQAYKFSGKFYANGLDFRRFPFETLRFPIAINLALGNVPADTARVHLVPDAASSGIGEYADLPGYITTGQDIRSSIRVLNTEFGTGEGKDRSISRAEMHVVFRKSMVAAVLQLFVPLLVVMAVVLLAPNLAGSLWDVRVALPSTALLTLVFLQQTYRDQLPSLPYVTFLDQIYSLSYATALAFFCLFVWSSNRLDQSTESNRAAVIDRINRVDLRFQIVATLVLAVLITLSWFVPIQ